MVRTSKKPDDYDAALGAAIRLRRRAAGLNLQTLADRCGLSLQQVQKYETGACRVPFSRLVQLAHALGAEVSDLVAMWDIGGSRAQTGLELYRRLGAAGASGAGELLDAYFALPRRARRPFITFAQRLAAGRGAPRRARLAARADPTRMDPDPADPRGD